ncbi:hypothetical protein BGK72_24600 [Streptomyces agglomeratus]|nr:hypothetical protein BGK72_24600 [Streptomyces agglomeratus]
MPAHVHVRALDTVQLGLALLALAAFDTDKKGACPVSNGLEEFCDQVGRVDVTTRRKAQVFLVELKDTVQSGVPYTVRHR